MRPEYFLSQCQEQLDRLQAIARLRERAFELAIAVEQADDLADRRVEKRAVRFTEDTWRKLLRLARDVLLVIPERPR